MMVILLEQQVRNLEEEKDQLCQQKVQLMLEIDEYKRMADNLAITIKDADKNVRGDMIEHEDYIDSLEE